MRKRLGLKWMGILALLMMLMWSLYGCGGGGSPSGEPNTPGEPATYIDPATGMEFVLVQGGCFEMGDTFGDGYEDERPVHEVCLDPFYMAKFPVTQGVWQAVMGENPSEDQECGPECPVEMVSWNEVQLFIEALNERGEKVFGLPTEAQWEYAARSEGKKEKYPGTDDVGALGEYAWYYWNAGEKTHPVGLKRPNGLGLHDMAGNVLEWVGDWFGPYSPEAKTNPTGPLAGEERVIRGSSYMCTEPFVRSTMRDSGDFNRFGPDFRLANLGFRVAFPVEP